MMLLPHRRARSRSRTRIRTGRSAVFPPLAPILALLVFSPLTVQSAANNYVSPLEAAGTVPAIVDEEPLSPFLNYLSATSNNRWEMNVDAAIGRGVLSSCVDIPKNLTLCNGIGYSKMRLPNLLDHDTMFEVSQQSVSWIPLLNIRCHPDTRRFLCSLFCPVCLDHQIYPCRSLCEKVRSGCENRMKAYGFPWPNMFSCKLFPKDNDMCITAEASALDQSDSENKCKICDQTSTVENILDHYCQSTMALRAKLKTVLPNRYIFKKVKVFKGSNITMNEIFSFESPEKCCEAKLNTSHSVYFIIGSFRDEIFTPVLITPWLTKHSKSFKKAVKMLKTLNCSDPENITHSVIDNSIAIPYPTVKTVTLKYFKHREATSNSTRNVRRQRKRKRKNNTVKPNCFRCKN